MCRERSAGRMHMGRDGSRGARGSRGLSWGGAHLTKTGEEGGPALVEAGQGTVACELESSRKERSRSLGREATRGEADERRGRSVPNGQTNGATRCRRGPRNAPESCEARQGFSKPRPVLLPRRRREKEKKHTSSLCAPPPPPHKTLLHKQHAHGAGEESLVRADGLGSERGGLGRPGGAHGRAGGGRSRRGGLLESTKVLRAEEETTDRVTNGVRLDELTRRPPA